jgi:hypothetical protein
MKKVNLTKLFFVVVFIGVVSTGIYAQSQNNEQRIVGTWTGSYERWGAPGRDGNDPNYPFTVVFNSNGTGKWGSDGTNFTYGISSSKLIIYYERFNSEVYDYFFSPDGRLFLYNFELDSGEIYSQTVHNLRKR